MAKEPNYEKILQDMEEAAQQRHYEQQDMILTAFKQMAEYIDERHDELVGEISAINTLLYKLMEARPDASKEDNSGALRSPLGRGDHDGGGHRVPGSFENGKRR